MYPLFHWLLMLVITVVATPAALFGRRRTTSHWRTARMAREGEAVELDAAA